MGCVSVRVLPAYVCVCLVRVMRNVIDPYSRGSETS